MEVDARLPDPLGAFVMTAGLRVEVGRAVAGWRRGWQGLGLGRRCGLTTQVGRAILRRRMRCGRWCGTWRRWRNSRRHRKAGIVERG